MHGSTQIVTKRLRMRLHASNLGIQFLYLNIKFFRIHNFFFQICILKIAVVEVEFTYKRSYYSEHQIFAYPSKWRPKPW